MSVNQISQRTNNHFFLVGFSALGIVVLLAGLHYGHLNSAADMDDLNVIHNTMTKVDQDTPTQRPGTVVKPVSCEKLPNVPGKSISLVYVEFPPGGYAPRHRHAGTLTAYVLKGKIRSQLNEGSIDTFGVGQSWIEPPGTIHTFAENVSDTEAATLLATFVADDNCGPLTIYE